MKTESLIDMLSRNAGPAPAALAARRLGLAAATGVMASAALAIGILGLVPAPQFATPAPWTKLAYCSALAVAAGALTARLSRPGADARHARAVLGAVLLVMLAIGGGSLALAPAGSRLEAVLGQSWWLCPWRVLALSMPALAVVIWAVRGLAPTRLGSAGFAAGLLAGALGAGGYALTCPEPSPAFVAVWYTLGISLTGVAGALLGRRWFRW